MSNEADVEELVAQLIAETCHEGVEVAVENRSNSVEVEELEPTETTCEGTDVVGTKQQNSGRFNCRQCGENFSQPSELWRHLREIHHPKAKPKFKCRECGEEFAFTCDFSRHTLKHLDSDISCESDQADRYRKLIQTAKTARESAMKIRQNRDGFECQECSKTFVSLWGLHNHSFIHGDIEFPCDRCGIVFSQPIALVDHKKSAHLNEVGKSQNSTDQMTTAKNACNTGSTAKSRRTAILTQKILNQMRRIEIRKTPPLAVFRCDKCPLLFTTQLILKQHQLDHSNQPNSDLSVDSLAEELSIDPVSTALSVLLSTACEIAQDCAVRIGTVLASMPEATQMETPMETEMVGNPTDKTSMCKATEMESPVETEFDCDFQSEPDESEIDLDADPIEVENRLITRSLRGLHSHSNTQDKSKLADNQSEKISSQPRSSDQPDIQILCETEANPVVIEDEPITAISSENHSAIAHVNQQSTAAEETANRVGFVVETAGVLSVACRLCDKTFVSLRGFQRHLNTHDRSKLAKIITSPPEIVSMSNPTGISTHSGTDVNPIVFEDEIITASSTVSQPIVTQGNRQSMAVGNVAEMPNFCHFVCRQCDKTFKTRRALHTHHTHLWCKKRGQLASDQPEKVVSRPKPLRQGNVEQTTTKLPSSVNNKRRLEMEDEIITASSTEIDSVIAEISQPSTAAKKTRSRGLYAGEKPQYFGSFACQCGKNYSSLKALRRHSKTHDKAKLADDQSDKITSQPRLPVATETVGNPMSNQPDIQILCETEANTVVMENELITPSSSVIPPAIAQISQQPTAADKSANQGGFVMKPSGRFECLECRETFSSLGGLQRHSKTHGKLKLTGDTHSDKLSEKIVTSQPQSSIKIVGNPMSNPTGIPTRSGTDVDPIVVEDEIINSASSTPSESAIAQVNQPLTAAETIVSRVAFVLGKPLQNLFDCRQCGKKFLNLAYLQSHSRLHRKSTVAQPKKIISPPKPLSANLERMAASLPECRVVLQRLEIEDGIITVSSTPTKSATAKVSQQSTAAAKTGHPVVFMLSKPLNSAGFVCRQCGKMFKTLKGLNVHSISHRNSKLAADQREKPQSHTRLGLFSKGRGKPDPVDLIPKPQRCHRCGERFTFNAELQLHSKNCVPQTFACARCGGKFNSSASLTAHLTLKHLPDGQVVQPVASRMFFSSPFIQ